MNNAENTPQELPIEYKIKNNINNNDELDLSYKKRMRLLMAAIFLVASAGAWRGYDRGVNGQEEANRTELEQSVQLSGCRDYISENTVDVDQQLTMKLSKIPAEAVKKCNFDSNTVELFSDEWGVKLRAETALPNVGSFEISKVYADADVVFPSTNMLDTKIHELEENSKDIDYGPVAVDMGVLSALSGFFASAFGALGFSIYALKKDRQSNANN